MRDRLWSWRMVWVLGLLVWAHAACAAAQSAEGRAEPFVGVVHEQVIFEEPRPIVVNIVTIDPGAPGLSFRLTPPNGDPNGDEPGDPNLETTRQTTLEYLVEQEAQLAVNASFFRFVEGTLNTDNVFVAVSEGRPVSPFEGRESALQIGPDNRPQIVRGAAEQVTGYDTEPPVELYNAVGGNQRLVEDGRVVVPDTTFTHTLAPRTAAGVTGDGRLVLVTVDGRQPRFSEGMTTRELARFLVARGVVDAVNLDGGGSTTLVMADPQPRVVNHPSDVGPSGEPGQLRPNGTNLAVFATPRPGYKPLAAAPRPEPLPALDYPREPVVLDGFEQGPGRFDGPLAGSGTTRGVDADRTAAEVVAGDAPQGARFQRLTVVPAGDGKPAEFRVRHLSSGADPAGNAMLGPVGHVGLWARTTTRGVMVSVLIDDRAHGPTGVAIGLERGVGRELVPDGRWRLYQWDLSAPADWRSFYAGNGAIEGPNAAIDSLLIEGAGPAGEPIVVDIDAVGYHARGTLEALAEPAR